jgi:hypothetical protein
MFVLANRMKAQKIDMATGTYEINQWDQKYYVILLY